MDWRSRRRARWGPLLRLEAKPTDGLPTPADGTHLGKPMTQFDQPLLGAAPILLPK